MAAAVAFERTRSDFQSIRSYDWGTPVPDEIARDNELAWRVQIAAADLFLATWTKVRMIRRKVCLPSNGTRPQRGGIAHPQRIARNALAIAKKPSHLHTSKSEVILSGLNNQ